MKKEDEKGKERKGRKEKKGNDYNAVVSETIVLNSSGANENHKSHKVDEERARKYVSRM